MQPGSVFVDEPIQVDYETASLGPRALVWRTERHEVTEVIRSWQDFRTPPYANHARGWLHRRHRNYYLLRLSNGEVAEVYLDRAGGQRNWVLLKWQQLVLELLTLGEWASNCYLLRCDDTAVIVDPAAEPDRILSALAGARVAAILLTHGHPDHCQALSAIRDATHAPVMIHLDDIAAFNVQADLPLQHGATVAIGYLSVRVVHTPGHTPGSVCLLFDQRALVGDTLFPGGPGHTDTPEALGTLLTTLTDTVFRWPDNTRFYPGHGPGSSIGEVRPAFARFLARPRPADLCGDLEWT